MFDSIEHCEASLSHSQTWGGGGGGGADKKKKVLACKQV